MSSVKSNCVKLINKATCPSPSSERAPMHQLDPQEAAVHLCIVIQMNLLCRIEMLLKHLC